MLVIISKSYCSPFITGPNKVVKSLVKGLGLIKFPYLINKQPIEGDVVWFHDDVKALVRFQNECNLGTCIVGPNISLTDNCDIDHTNIILLQPSVWANQFCRQYRYDKSPTVVWAAGVDSEAFSRDDKQNRSTVLIYFKQRFEYELNMVENFLKNRNIKYDVIRYGSYKEEDYKKLLNTTKYVIWIGRQESQGIALLEALAMGVPMVVWDVLCAGHWNPVSKNDKKFFSQGETAFDGATSCPYFNTDCGYVEKNFDELKNKISLMETNFLSFDPSKYVRDNLSPEKQAKVFLEILKKSVNDFTERTVSDTVIRRNWRNYKIWSMLYQIRSSLNGIRKLFK